jgi:hypothetical protein
MCYHQLQDLASLHVAELRQVGEARSAALVSSPRTAAERRPPAVRQPSLRARMGWRLVTIGLSLAAHRPASQRLPAG